MHLLWIKYILMLFVFKTSIAMEIHHYTIAIQLTLLEFWLRKEMSIFEQRIMKERMLCKWRKKNWKMLMILMIVLKYKNWNVLLHTWARLWWALNFLYIGILIFFHDVFFGTYKAYYYVPEIQTMKLCGNVQT